VFVSGDAFDGEVDTRYRASHEGAWHVGHSQTRNDGCAHTGNALLHLLPMPVLLLTSLVLNIAVLIPVCSGLMADGQWAHQTYGPKTPARQILFAIYSAILGLSVALLFWPHTGIALGLLLAQIAYKVLTPLTVGTWRHPVVLSNMAIALVHLVTVSTLLRQASRV
jgi:hypothetical protein